MKKSKNLFSKLAVLSGAVLFASSTFANATRIIEEGNSVNATSVDVEHSLDQVLPLALSVSPFMYNGDVNIRCSGQNSGRATCVSTGGVAPYSYSWSHDPSWTGNLAYGLFAGTYSVTVTDAAGTSVSKSYTLIENTPLVASISATEVLCNGGTAQVTTSASGGTIPYNGIFVTTADAGPHSYTVSDANGCRSVMSITITEPDVLVASATASEILCYGQTSSVAVDAIGGTTPYSGVGVKHEIAGNHDYLVTDANGCSGSVALTISQPNQIIASATYTEIECYGGTSVVTVTVMSGTEPYGGEGDFTENAGYHEYHVTDFNGCSGQVSVTIPQPSMLIAEATTNVVDCNGGTASVSISGSGGSAPYTGTGPFVGTIGVNGIYTITDYRGCTATVNYLPTSTVKVNVTPSYFMLDCLPEPVTIDALVMDGAEPYTYLWSTGETTSSITVSPKESTLYDVTITDANGCSASTNGGSMIDVINRCGNNNQKIVICHVPSGNGENPQTICISPNALDPHMLDAWNLHGGDYCGPCQSSMSIALDEENNGDNNFISVGMNTNNETVELSYRLGYDSDVLVEIYDMTGALVEMIHQGRATEGQLYDFVVNPSKFTTGVYIYQFITNTERHIDKLHFIH